MKKYRTFVPTNKGFLAIFLLDMGIRAGRELGDMRQNGLLLFASLFPFIGVLIALSLASFLTPSPVIYSCLSC